MTSHQTADERQVILATASSYNYLQIRLLYCSLTGDLQRILTDAQIEQGIKTMVLPECLVIELMVNRELSVAKRSILDKEKCSSVHKAFLDRFGARTELKKVEKLDWNDMELFFNTYNIQGQEVQRYLGVVERLHDLLPPGFTEALPSYCDDLPVGITKSIDNESEVLLQNMGKHAIERDLYQLLMARLILGPDLYLTDGWRCWTQSHQFRVLHHYVFFRTIGVGEMAHHRKQKQYALSLSILLEESSSSFEEKMAEMWLSDAI